MSRGVLMGLLVTCLAGAVALPQVAYSAPIASGTVTFENTDVGPYFLSVLNFKVYTPGDADNPVPAGSYPSVNTDFTYVYTLTNDVSSVVPLDGLDIEIRPGVTVTATGTLDDGDTETIAPSAITVGASLLSYDFFNPLIPKGKMTEMFFFTSPYTPGDVVISCVFDGVGEDELGPLAGPSELGGTSPRTIGYWKNQYQDRGPNDWTDAQLNEFAQDAVDLSGGVFATMPDLISALVSKGARPMDVRAKQQFAALLLNVVSGILGDGVPVSNTLTTATTVRGARLEVMNLILSGTDYELAKNIADDINNGIGVYVTT
jgi:hypothetical protein